MQFSYSKMEENYSEMQIIINNINANLNEIVNIKNQLANSDIWQGNARNSYYQKFSTLVDTFDTVKQELNNDVAFLRNAIDKYDRLDKQILVSITNGFKW